MRIGIQECALHLKTKDITPGSGRTVVENYFLDYMNDYAYG